MKPVFSALGSAAANLLHPRMLWLMIWPMLVAAGFWGIAALFLWVRTAMRIADENSGSRLRMRFCVAATPAAASLVPSSRKFESRRRSQPTPPRRGLRIVGVRWR